MNGESEDLTDEVGDPRAEDKLFSDCSGNWRLNAYIQSDAGLDSAWYRYIEGYRIAAQAVLAKVADDYKGRDFVIYPIVFLYRHHFELCLKAIVIFGNDLFGRDYKFPDHHFLDKLWVSAREILEKRWKSDPVLDVIEKQLRELSRVDPGSFSYRYPVKKDGKTVSHPEWNPANPKERFSMVNIEHFCKVAFRLSNFLTGCAYGLWNELDEQQQADADAREWADDAADYWLS